MSTRVAKFIPRSGARGDKRERSPGAESLWGRRITAEGAGSLNNVTRTAVNRVHLLPKNLICGHGGGKLASCPWRHLTSLRPCSPVNTVGPVAPKIVWPRDGLNKWGVPHNTDFSCCDLYEKIKSNQDFVKKVYSLQKNMIGQMCKSAIVWTLSGFLVKYIIF